MWSAVFILLSLPRASAGLVRRHDARAVSGAAELLAAPRRGDTVEVLGKSYAGDPELMGQRGVVRQLLGDVKAEGAYEVELLDANGRLDGTVRHFRPTSLGLVQAADPAEVKAQDAAKRALARFSVQLRVGEREKVGLSVTPFATRGAKPRHLLVTHVGPGAAMLPTHAKPWEQIRALDRIVRVNDTTGVSAMRALLSKKGTTLYLTLDRPASEGCHVQLTSDENCKRPIVAWSTASAEGEQWSWSGGAAENDARGVQVLSKDCKLVEVFDEDGGEKGYSDNFVLGPPDVDFFPRKYGLGIEGIKGWGSRGIPRKGLCRRLEYFRNQDLVEDVSGLFLQAGNQYGETTLYSR